MSKIIIRKARSHSAVPDDALTDGRLPLDARAILGWLLGRPDGWVVKIGHMLKVMHAKQATWNRVRKQLIATGYFCQTRGRGEDGKVEWESIVIYPPVSSTGLETTNGTATDGSVNNGSAIDGQTHHITKDGLPEELNQRKGNKAAAEREPAAAFPQHPSLETKNAFGIVVENMEDQRRLDLLRKYLPGDAEMKALCDLLMISQKGGGRLYTSRLLNLLPEYLKLTSPDPDD